jgi:hypothetical protein
MPPQLHDRIEQISSKKIDRQGRLERGRFTCTNKSCLPSEFYASWTLLEGELFFLSAFFVFSFLCALAKSEKLLLGNMVVKR